MFITFEYRMGKKVNILARRSESGFRSCMLSTLNTALALTLGFFIVFGQAGIHSQSKSDSVVSSKKENHPFDTPYSSDSSSEEQSTQDEKGAKDSADDEWSKLSGTINPAEWSKTIDCKCSLTQLQRSIQNRSSVSLFVLHHSWKSSIC